MSTMSDYDYDMQIIGSGPVGKSEAIQSKKLGKTASLDWINRVGA
ncbi:MAG: hypothetical protein QGI49_11935 [SAR202 cluster bacterium]|nr:hypothetical protein [SAR202 cluster bacterium]